MFPFAPPRPAVSLLLAVAATLTRIFSDLHYGDRASRVRSLTQLRPLTDGVAHLVLNGDTLDTRPGPAPIHTAACQSEVLAFFPQHAPQVTLITGNHDADLTNVHALDLAEGALFVTHGDVLYEDIVPWSRDADFIRLRIDAALAALPEVERAQLAVRLAVWRRVAAAIPQRHQSETRRLRYAVDFLRDTIWPPSRVWRVLQTWRREPALAAAFVREHRPRARFFAIGHTHRPGAWQTPSGIVVLNTGSFCRPLGGSVIDLTHDRLTLRRIVERGGEFRVGATLAEFSLAGVAVAPTLAS